MLESEKDKEVKRWGNYKEKFNQVREEINTGFRKGNIEKCLENIVEK